VIYLTISFFVQNEKFPRNLSVDLAKWISNYDDVNDADDDGLIC
jgi:hypothetical protein